MKIWQKIAACVAVILGALCLFGAISLMFTSPGPGEVSVILHGAFIVMGLTLAVVCAGFAVWFLLWRIKWLRWSGFALIAGVMAYSSYLYLDSQVADWQQDRAEARVAMQEGIVADRYLARLVAEAPNPYQSRQLFLEFLEARRAVDGYSSQMSENDRAFRARWFIYYWTFYDPSFEGFTTYYPKRHDCQFFLDHFGDRYAEIAPVAVFDDLCTDRWNADGTERDG